MTTDPVTAEQVGTDEEFMENVREARENGYDVACIQCGVGVAPDGMDIHERGCSFYVEFDPHG